MNSLDIDVIRTALSWQSRGQRVVMGTVVRTWGSAPRPPGSLMVIRDDGQVAGSVSGGCIEDDLIGRVARGELALRKPETTTYGETAEEARRFGLPCGGTVQLVLELLSPASQLRELLAAIEGHHGRHARPAHYGEILAAARAGHHQHGAVAAGGCLVLGLVERLSVVDHEATLAQGFSARQSVVRPVPCCACSGAT